MTPTDSQYSAIRNAADWYHLAKEGRAPQVLTIGGFAGTGKSTIIPFVLDECGLASDDIGFCAPTGKAAKVVNEKLVAQGIGKIAKTIHSSIYLPKPLRADILEMKFAEATRVLMDARMQNRTEVLYEERLIPLSALEQITKVYRHDLDKAYVDNDGPSFTINSQSVFFERDLIIVDEGSMVGMSVADDLRAIGRPILVMGDPGQLPPVKDEEGFNLQEPDIFLTEIHRQAADNPIIQLATLARQGELMKLGVYGDGRARVIKAKNDDVTYDVDKDVQVIVGTHRHKWNVTSKIRKEAGYDSSAPLEGEPLICCRNSKAAPSMVNGSSAVVVEGPSELVHGRSSFAMKVLDEDGVQRTCVVNQGLFEEHQHRQRNFFSCDKRLAYQSRKNDEHFDFGWAITCHKSQGSSWPNVVVHDESGAFRDDAAKWLYTAITRASETLTVVI